jgi:hypothetical protein
MTQIRLFTFSGSHFTHISDRQLHCLENEVKKKKSKERFTNLSKRYEKSVKKRFTTFKRHSSFESFGK